VAQTLKPESPVRLGPGFRSIDTPWRRKWLPSDRQRSARFAKPPIRNDGRGYVVSPFDKQATQPRSDDNAFFHRAADQRTFQEVCTSTRVARQLDLLKSSFETTTDIGKDGLVRTFAALCSASVAYQKRLEPVLTLALNGADGKTLLAWSKTVLPALKGEPHARARAVVEGRLNMIPRAYGQQIADFLGIKLRLRYR